MPGNRFPFAVRIRCQIDVVDFGDGGGDGIDMLAVTDDQFVFHGELLAWIDCTLFGHQVAYVAARCKDFGNPCRDIFQGFRLMAIRRSIDWMT